MCIWEIICSFNQTLIGLREMTPLNNLKAFSIRSLSKYNLTTSQPGVNCWPAPEVSENMNTKEVGNLQLTSNEEEAIVAFLRTLSDRNDCKDNECRTENKNHLKQS